MSSSPAYTYFMRNVAFNHIINIPHRIKQRRITIERHSQYRNHYQVRYRTRYYHRYRTTYRPYQPYQPRRYYGSKYYPRPSHNMYKQRVGITNNKLFNFLTKN